jgi:hypothetical protein
MGGLLDKNGSFNSTKKSSSGGLLSGMIGGNTKPPAKQVTKDNWEFIQSKEPSLIETGLRKFTAASDAFSSPLMKVRTFGLTSLADRAGSFLADKTMQLFDETPAEREARHQKIALRDFRSKEDISPTTRKVANVTGTIAGFAQPTQLAYKTLGRAGVAGLSKLAPNAGKLVTEGVRGASAGLGVGALEGILAGRDAKGIAESAAIGAAGGAILDPAFMKLGQVARGLFSKGKIEPVQIPKTEPSPRKQLGVLKPKNTALDDAVNRYNEAVETVQNHFGTNELRADEMARVKSELGIDFEDLINNIEKAEQGVDIRGMGERGRLSRVAGLTDTPPLPKRTLKPVGADPLTQPSEAAPTTDTRTKIVSGNKKSPGGGLWERLNRFYARTVDTQRPISRFTKDANLDDPLNPKVLASNSRNTQGITSHIFEDGLVDSHGNQIGEGYRALLKSVPKDLEKDFSDYLLHKHNVARMAQNKPVFGDVSADMSKAKIAEYEALHPEFKDLGGKVNNFIDTFMQKWAVETGLLTPEQYQAMKEMYPDYVPTYRSFDELEKGLNTFGKKGKSFVGQSAGIKKATGSERPIIDPLESVMGLVDKTVKAAKHNEVGQSIVRAIKENPEAVKRWAEIVPSPEGLVDDINKVLKEEGLEGVIEKFGQDFDKAFTKTALNKDNIVRVMVDGQPVYLKINDKSFLDAIRGLTNSDQGTIERAFRKGTGLYKALITGKNPFFAIRNIARDIPTAYINGSEKNPVKFLIDLLTSGKEILAGGKQFQEFKALGGGRSNFFAQDAKLLKNGKSIPGKMVGAIEGFNNFTETVPRFAEYRRTANRGGNTYGARQQGLFASNEVTTNFARSGDVTKSADAYIPYFNPAVQGLDKVVRQSIQHPIATILKGATVITAPTLILNHINKDNPNYQKLDNRTKDNYYLIPRDDGTFFKIPKSREMGVLFSTLAERIIRSSSGEQGAFKGFRNTVLTNFAPSNPIENNIFGPLGNNIPKNRDFANRTIVPMSMQDRSPQYQYDDQTSEIAKKIGEITNLSPKQIDYVIKSYTGVVGQLLLPATTKANYLGGSSLQKVLKPISTQFTADPLYSNQTLTDFYDNYDRLKQISADRNFTENIPSKAVTPEERAKNAFAKASKEITGITKQIKEVEKTGNAAEIRRLRQKMIDIADQYNGLLAQSQVRLK